MCSNRTTTILAGYDHGIEVLAYDYVEAFAETSRLSPSERARAISTMPRIFVETPVEWTECCFDRAASPFRAP